MKRIIELFGLPGAGKSTLCSEIRQKGIAGGYSLGTREEMLVWWDRAGLLSRMKAGFFFLRSFPAIAVKILTADKKGMKSARRIAWVFWFSSKLRVFIQASSYEIIIFDQLFLQDAWSLLIDGVGKDPDWGRGLLTTLIGSSGIQYEAIYLDVDSGVAAARVFRRSKGTSRFDGMELERIKQNFIDAVWNFDFIRKCCPKSVTVHHFACTSDGAGFSDGSVAELSTRLWNLLRGANAKGS